MSDRRTPGACWQGRRAAERAHGPAVESRPSPGFHWRPVQSGNQSKANRLHNSHHDLDKAFCLKVKKIKDKKRQIYIKAEQLTIISTFKLFNSVSNLKCPFISLLCRTEGENIPSLVNRVCWLLLNVIGAAVAENIKSHSQLTWETTATREELLNEEQSPVPAWPGSNYRLLEVKSCCRHSKVLSSWMGSKSFATATLNCRLGLHTNNGLQGWGGEKPSLRLCFSHAGARICASSNPDWKGGAWEGSVPGEESCIFYIFAMFCSSPSPWGTCKVVTAERERAGRISNQHPKTSQGSRQCQKKCHFFKPSYQQT